MFKKQNWIISAIINIHQGSLQTKITKYSQMILMLPISAAKTLKSISSNNNGSATQLITEIHSQNLALQQTWQNSGWLRYHVTHPLMLVIICGKYRKNPSRTVDATELTWFSRSRPNDLENIGQGLRSLHMARPLMLMMICAKYGKNASRIVDFVSRWKPKK